MLDMDNLPDRSVLTLIVGALVFAAGVGIPNTTDGFTAAQALDHAEKFVDEVEKRYGNCVAR